MKKLFPIILLLLSQIANGQVKSYMHTKPLWVSSDSSLVELLNIRHRQVMVQELLMGKKAVYIPETDIEAGNGLNQKSKVIVYQIPLSQVVSESKKLKISKAIDDILAAPDTPIYDTIRTVVTEIIDDSDPRNVLSGSMIKATNNVTSNGFYQMTLTYRNNIYEPAKVTFKFTGDGFVWMGERKSTHGSVNVIVDGIPTLVLCNEPLPKIQANDQELFRKVGMENKEHTVELVPVGNSQFVHDRFVTYKTNIAVVQRQ